MSLRDYGLPNFPRPKGKPSWVICDPPVECHNCGAILCTITVQYEVVASLKEGAGTGTYLGCPACPFASPCVVIPKGDPTDG